MTYEPAFILGAVDSGLLECLFAPPGVAPGIEAEPAIAVPRPVPTEIPFAEKLYLSPGAAEDTPGQQSLRSLLAQRGFATLDIAQPPQRQLAQSMQAAREIVGWAETLAGCLAWCRPNAAICCLTPPGTALAAVLPQTAALHRLFLGYVAGSPAPDGAALFDPADIETALDILHLYASAPPAAQA